MEHLEWEWLSKSHKMEQAAGPDGKWIISPRGDVWDIKFNPAYPKGEDYKSLSDRFATIPDDPNNGDFWPKEKQFIWAHIGSPQELGFGQSPFEAKKLIELLRAGDADLPSPEQMLRELGFEDRYHHKTSITWSHKTKKNLNINIGDEGHIIVRYEKANLGSWHNLMQLMGTRVGYRGNSKHWTFYPKATKDHLRVGVSFIQWMMNERDQRGGRFAKPLN